jgi:hypothetical protein
LVASHYHVIKTIMKKILILCLSLFCFNYDNLAQSLPFRELTDEEVPVIKEYVSKADRNEWFFDQNYGVVVIEEQMLKNQRKFWSLYIECFEDRIFNNIKNWGQWQDVILIFKTPTFNASETDTTKYSKFITEKAGDRLLARPPKTDRSWVITESGRSTDPPLLFKAGKPVKSPGNRIEKGCGYPLSSNYVLFDANKSHNFLEKRPYPLE